MILVSHCLLNENTRYAGGATRPGAVAEVVDGLMAAGCGIHQLSRPERLASGGVLKRQCLRLYRSDGGPLQAVRGALLGAFVRWTEVVYRLLARRAARDVSDYQRAGMVVAGVVEIGASPSCGVSLPAFGHDLAAELCSSRQAPLATGTSSVLGTDAAGNSRAARAR